MFTPAAPVTYTVEANKDESTLAKDNVSFDTAPQKHIRQVDPEIEAMVNRDIENYKKLWVALAS